MTPEGIMASKLIIKTKNIGKNICRNPTQALHLQHLLGFQDWMYITHYFLLEYPQNYDYLIIHITRILEENLLMSRRKKSY